MGLLSIPRGGGAAFCGERLVVGGPEAVTLLLSTERDDQDASADHVDLCS